MNTKLLKQKILDLAIRGKLTDQCKSDGTARELLEKISASRRIEQSAKSAKSKDSAPIVPLDKSEAPFEIPDNWEWVKLGDVGKTITGATPSKNHPEYEGDEIPFLSPGDISQANTITSYESQGLSKQGKILARPVPANTVLQVCIGGSIGKCAIVDREVCFNQQINSISVLIAKYEYIYAVLQSLYFQNEIILKATGTATPIINKSSWDNLLVPLPPLAEQQRIIAKIEEVFAEIDAIEKNKELLKTHIKQTRQKILDLAIHGKLVPQNKSDEPASVLLERITRDNPHYEKMEDEPFEIPENWVWCRLGNICDKLIDGDHNPPKGLNCTTEYIMLSSRNINDNDIVDLENVRYLSKDMFEEENLRTKLEKGDILFTSVGSLGRSCVFSGDGKYCFQRSVSVIHTNIYNKYLKYFFDSNYYQKYIVENATGTAQLGFYLEQMRKSFIAIPPLNEQSRIVAKIEELFSTLDQMERNLV